ncbi:flavin reductase family protein [Chitinasiproducens palmae]|uniref:NADH-FMN oxidoreductase RutF, flavin reductase (DIM6/NTAB) family n=1 Tax=Chitinasiproducens palmae TaxID=1770053 RepID=A0A1H2PW33_9BURK|nr:flavin reductase family protein [Chitinasiproducens palmae]SDV51533.1 NADH-FMN oxidoreductase RutF, flavin reductase (DIM6/NTAB) family [Chitinasiproducens palmae]
MNAVEMSMHAPAAAEDAALAMQASFKQAMRRLAGGVALLATVHDGVRHGMTVTAVSSLTMEPPALLVSVNRSASAFAAFAASARFSVNLLAEAQADLASAFARKPDGDARFANGAWRTGVHGMPVLDGALASIVCRVHDTVTFGTHAILIGRVEQLAVGPLALDEPPRAPLLFLSGQFGAFRPMPR